MFCTYKNSYLQLPHQMNPMLVNKSVRRAMRKSQFDPHDEIPAAQRLESMQPSLYAPCVDITRARRTLGRRGLCLINKNIHSEDSLAQLQALHTLLDQVQISENALSLIELNVVYRVIQLMMSPDPIVQEKVLLILTQLSSYYQGRKQIMSQPIVINYLMALFMQDRKEIRYAAAFCLKTLAKNRTACEVIMKNDKIIENLLRMIKQDYVGIVLLHLNTLNNLCEWDPTRALKANGFNILVHLLRKNDSRLVQASLDCLTQLCKHNVGQKLADQHHITVLLRKLLAYRDLGVAISAVGLLMYTTLTVKSKWHLKECLDDLANQMVIFCVSYSVPVLQLRAMQVLINMCDLPDMRNYIKHYWEKSIKHGVKVKTFEQWDGASEPAPVEVVARHNYRTKYIPNQETIKNDFGDSAIAVNARSYLRCVKSKKAILLKLLNYRPDEE